MSHQIHHDEHGNPFSPCAHPDCLTCNGSGIVECVYNRGVCEDCINVDVPHYDELGTAD